MRVWGKVVAAIAAAAWLGITCLGASAEMREITVRVKYCAGTTCTEETSVPVEIDWNDGTIEFVKGTTLQGARLRFGLTVGRIDVSP